jgi:bacterioferritin-associated ferredoxin
MNDGTMLCRCEEVTAPEVEAAMDEGATTLNDIKRRTRAGMGMCQARWCSHALAARVAQRTGQPLMAVAAMTARPPVYPISLGVLADTEA